MSQGYQVNDYVHLYLTDATRNGDFYTWVIPSSYYTNRRSSVCTIESVGGTISTTSATVKGLVINYVNGAQNSYASGNVPAVLCHGYEATAMDFTLTKDIQLLVEARPQEVTLKITADTGVSADTAPLKGCLSLKFSYYNALQTGELLHGQYTPTL
tara:strand:- start:224 stop:691 length:468 start_codon:yes stop_codon:yes gene_type:complete